jgi:hypothetical protein
MQNRRLSHDDGRGVGEALNEVNSNYQGIMVDSDYYVQFYQVSTGKSLQTKIQQSKDEAVQLFFNFEVSASLEAS